MVEAGNSARLEAIGTPKEIADGKIAIKWVGKPDDVCYIGYPFINSREVGSVDTDGMPKKEIVPFLPDLGINLKILFWSAEHHCFCCVRGDVYVD